MTEYTVSYHGAYKDDALFERYHTSLHPIAEGYSLLLPNSNLVWTHIAPLGERDHFFRRVTHLGERAFLRVLGDGKVNNFTGRRGNRGVAGIVGGECEDSYFVGGHLCDVQGI